MRTRHILAIDQGTTGSRAFLFDEKGRVVKSAYQEFKQYFPKPGWVEHDAQEIWQSCEKVIRQVLSRTKIIPFAVGITNQRETTVLWDRKTSRPIYRAIVWQCRRTAGLCKKLRNYEFLFRQKTGLRIDPYFSGTKIKWLLDNVPGLRSKTRRGEICFGTIDSWLIWKLTGGESHLTDFTNASRTLIFNIRTKAWDQELLKILSIPEGILPRAQESGSFFGRSVKIAGLPSGIPITGVMGDQQSALYGQGCYKEGTIKNTYGTGCFMVLNTGKNIIISRKGLLTTLACDEKGKSVYALEGSIFIAGAVVQWLRDQLKIIQRSAETEQRIKNLKDNEGVYFVPAFTGLGAPYWNSQARGTIFGLTRGSNQENIIRAALESVAYQTKDVFDLMQEESGKKIQELRVDGGACKNNFLMQFQADMLGCRIMRPRAVESTAQGVAYLAGITAGLWHGRKDLKECNAIEKVFSPKLSPQVRKRLYNGWLSAVQGTMAAC